MFNCIVNKDIWVFICYIEIVKIVDVLLVYNMYGIYVIMLGFIFNNDIIEFFFYLVFLGNKFVFFNVIYVDLILNICLIYKFLL